MRLRSLARPQPAWSAELDKELRFHLEQQAAENLAAGMPHAKRARPPCARLGGVSHIQEECRDMRRTQYLENLGQDLRYACACWARARLHRW